MLQVGLDLGIYDTLTHHSSPMSCRDIVSEGQVDLTLLERILRNLAALGHIDEAEPGTYQANKVTTAFTTPKGVNLARFSYG